ncbi:class A beta-lactamase [Luteimonas sp. R10]|uniref:class A beta-lactamase n=1 Tax=Luteimonas sp. R10 TaxID=3108176 RepID=UPI00308D5A62|nr:class A beta-lactamase [Luteimonas sp. R10]
MIDRRGFLRATGAAIALAGLGKTAAAMDAPGLPGLAPTLAELARDSGGRLGVAVLDGGSGRQAGLHADERFPMCSTFKFLLAAAVLQRVDRGRERLDRSVPIAESDLVPHSPLTEKHVGADGMRVGDLCRATMIWSDNAAANLLLRTLGGPAGLTRFARDLGDPHTRLDRWEPELNSAIPGDPRDTTTPAAMARHLQRLLLGDVLHAASRALLAGWLVDNRTGDARLRAGLPNGWRVGDKTGTSINAADQGSANDIAIVWPPGRRSLLIACYLTEAAPDIDAMNAVHAAVARAVAAATA